MPIPKKEDVRPVLQSFEMRLRNIVEASWQEWIEVVNRGRFSSRTRASMVFDFIRRRAIAEFAGDQQVKTIEKGQTVQFLFNDSVLLRIKKANGAGLGSNIPTQAVLEFVDPQLTIRNLLPEIFKVEVCYHVGRLGTRLEQIAVTARQRDKLLWSYPLEKQQSADILPLPSASSEQAASPAVQVRVKKPRLKSAE